MKTNNFAWKAPAFALAALFLFSCKKSNDVSGVNYEFKATNPSSTVSRTAGAISWTSGFAHVSELKFEAKAADVQVNYKSKADQKINLFAPQSALGAVALPPAAYKKIELKINLLPGATEAAFELAGTHGSTPLLFRVAENFEFKTAKDAFDIAAATGYTAATAINLSLLTQGVTAAMLNNAALTNGTLVISATSNANIYSVMLNNLKNLNNCDLKK